jgi:hypothetical protein
MRLSGFERRAAHVRASLPATVMREGRLVYAWRFRYPGTP